MSEVHPLALAYLRAKAAAQGQEPAPPDYVNLAMASSRAWMAWLAARCPIDTDIDGAACSEETARILVEAGVRAALYHVGEPISDVSSIVEPVIARLVSRG